MKRVLFVLAIFCWAGLSGETVSAQIQFIRYKNFMIPISLQPRQPNLVANNDASRDVFLSWTYAPNIERYELEQFYSEQVGWTVIYSGLRRSFLALDQPIGNVLYRVRACADSCGRYSTEQQVRVVGGGYSPSGGSRYADDDGDGILNTFDLCAGTETNVAVNPLGCSESQFSQLSNDTVNCIDPSGNVRAATYCNAGELTDSDRDGVADDVDPYPLQASTQCLP